MKLTTQFSAAVASVSLLVAAQAQEFTVPGVTTAPKSAQPAPAQPAPSTPAAATPAAPTPAAPAPTTPAAPATYTDLQLSEAFGYIFVLQTQMSQQLQALEFTPQQREAVLRGIGMAMTGKQLPYDPQQVQAQLQAFMAKKQETFMGKLRTQQITANNEFFTKLKENKAVTETPSGLRFEVVKAGTGAVAKPGQLVTFHYTGSFVTGQPFDSSVERGQPMEVVLKSASPQQPDGVIAGMFEGLQKTGVGGKLKLYIPPSLAYGDEGVPGGIPPAAALIFEVEIVGVKDAPPAPATPAAK